MRQFYSVQTAILHTTPPLGKWHALQCPGLPTWSLLVMEEWEGHTAQDVWEALPSVTEHYPENWNQLVPTALVTAFGPWGVVATDTIRQAMRKVQTQWAAARF